VVKISIGGGGELKSSETDIVKSFVIDTHDLICIFDQLVDRESSIVGFYDGI